MTEVVNRKADWSVTPPEAAWPTPFSFAQSFIRYASEQGMRVKRTHWEIDGAGRGIAAYRVDLCGYVFSWVAASFMLAPHEHEDRIVATKWDSTSLLVEGEATVQDFVDVKKEVTNVLWGRARPGTLVWSRGNRSVRLFDHTVQALARNAQPDPDRLAAIGYLFRTTGFSANGRNGMQDYPALVETKHPLRGCFHAQMLSSYLWREFSIHLVEHLARQINPGAAVLAPDYRRYVGVGNSSGVGLAPFIARHPLLIAQWSEIRRERLRATGELELTSTCVSDQTLAEDMAKLIRTAVKHFREQPSAEFERFTSGKRIAEDLIVANELLAFCANEELRVSEFMSRAQCLLQDEALEVIKSIILEATNVQPESERLDEMTADETLKFNPGMTCGHLRDILIDNFGEALQQAAASRSGDYYFWYYSEENSEPRRGEPHQDVGEEYSIPLDIKGRLQELKAALDRAPADNSVAQMVLEYPNLHYITSWVQTLATRINEFASIDFMARDFVPVDMLRFQLAIYGMLKMRTTSPNRLRGTLLQGAPSPDELGNVSMPLFPVAPRFAEGQNV